MLSLIIPCFNEEKNLNKLLEKLNSIIHTYPQDKIEIIIVENRSTDDSFKILTSSNLYLQKKINIVKIEKNIGYGDGIMQGIKLSKGDLIAWCHADLQTDPQDVIKIFKLSEKKLNEEDCIAKGRRINRNFIDIFFTTGMSILTLIMFNLRLNDINAQPKIFNKKFIKFLSNAPKDFSFDIFLLLKAKKNNFKIYEYPVVWHKRFAGEAKGGGSLKLKIKLTIRTISFMINLRKNFKWN